MGRERTSSRRRGIGVPRPSGAAPAGLRARPTRCKRTWQMTAGIVRDWSSGRGARLLSNCNTARVTGRPAGHKRSSGSRHSGAEFRSRTTAASVECVRGDRKRYTVHKPKGDYSHGHFLPLLSLSFSISLFLFLSVSVSPPPPSVASRSRTVNARTLS